MSGLLSHHVWSPFRSSFLSEWGPLGGRIGGVGMGSLGWEDPGFVISASVPGFGPFPDLDFFGIKKT